MQITNDMRLEALRKAPEAVQDLYGSLETAQLIKVVMSTYKLQNDEFVNVVGDTILGLYPKSNFRKLLKVFIGASDEVAENIEKDMSNLLYKIDGIPVIPVASKEVTAQLDMRPADVSPDMQTASKPLTREDVLRAIAPKRTMASDIESVRQMNDEKNSE